MSQNLRGTIKNVEVKFAYVRTEIGDVFVPLSAAVPKNQDCPDLRDVYTYGDEVNLKAAQQTLAKNGCNYRAVYMRKVKKNLSSVGSPSSQVSHVEDLLRASIVSVTETFAYADIPEYGSIFVPGNSFDSSETTRLNSYLQKGDFVAVKIEEQKEMNGCAWKATHATKIEPVNEAEDSFSGFGKITELGDYHCRVFSNELSIYVYCNILCYTGGDFGMNAETLREILTVGDYVMFNAQFREPDVRAINWYPFRSRGVDVEDIARHVNKNYCESHTQTNVCMEFRLARCVRERHPELHKKYENMLEVIEQEDSTRLLKIFLCEKSENKNFRVFG